MTLEEKTLEIKKDSLRLLHIHNGGHEEDALCCVEALAALYLGVMKLRPEEPDWPDRDRFVMSAWPCRAVYYAALAQRGFFPREELERVVEEENLYGYGCAAGLPGVDAVAASVAEGMEIAVDMALRARAEIKIYRSFVMISQADCLSGRLWENAIRASENMLEDLTVILCRKRGDILPGADNICAKFSAFGFDTFSVEGDNVAAIGLALSLPRRSGKPLFVCCELK